MVVHVIDRRLLRLRQARAHRRATSGADFLMQNFIADLAERLAGTDRAFSVAVAYGGQSDSVADSIQRTGKIDRVLRIESSPAALRASAFPAAVADEEALPLAQRSVDLFVSALSLQWANDLPGALIQIRRALKPGGLFLGALMGGRTLAELREALFVAESELSGGASLRVSPALPVNEAGMLLQRAGFDRPVADRDVLTVRYGAMEALFADLRAMGATNALVDRIRKPARRVLFSHAGEIYRKRFSDVDGRLRASFEIVWLSGWAPPSD